jgi:hypothetical protein
VSKSFPNVFNVWTPVFCFSQSVLCVFTYVFSSSVPSSYIPTFYMFCLSLCSHPLVFSLIDTLIICHTLASLQCLSFLVLTPRHSRSSLSSLKYCFFLCYLHLSTCLQHPLIYFSLLTALVSYILWLYFSSFFYSRALFLPLSLLLMLFSLQNFSCSQSHLCFIRTDEICLRSVISAVPTVA